MPARRIGAPDSAQRTRLLDAAERVMLEDGYAAVTSRRVGTAAGMAPQLVHYYFRSMDELFIEIFRRRAEEGLERFAGALADDASLRAIWRFSTDPPGPRFNLEFEALANHRKPVRAVINHYAERFGAMQLDAVVRALEDLGLSEEEHPPVALLTVFTGVSQILGLQRAAGMTAGHPETEAFVERLIDDLERRSLSRGSAGSP